LRPAAINRPDQPEISKGAKGSAAVRAQILLSRAHFSVGEIDGFFGSNMSKALAAYQTARNLPASGRVDAATWAALNADTAPVLIEYAVTAEDAAGPFLPIPKDLKEQAKLPRMGYTSLLEALGERAHASLKLLRALNPAARFEGAGESLTLPNAAVMPPGRAAKIEVSKSESSIRAYDAEGRLLAYYPATAGSTHDPLPIGDWKINGVAAIRSFTTTLNSSGMRRTAMKKPCFLPDPTTRSAWSGSIFRRTTTAYTARLSPRGSAMHIRMAASA
jgi:hypothetical protein